MTLHDAGRAPHGQSTTGTDPSGETWDFFVSRAGPDAAFSSEIARILASEGCRVLVQEQDFANRSFMERMHAGLKSGARVIALLSPDYLTRDHCEAEWQGAIADDPLNRSRRLIVMRVRESKPVGLLSVFAYWDLVPLRGNLRLLRDVVLAAVRDEVPALAAPYRRTAEVLLHSDIRDVPGFAGRSEDLDNIRLALTSAGEATASIAVAVHGTPGVGKSMLVRKFAWENRHRYAGVWWLPAETQDRILEGFIALGATFVQGLDRVKDRHQAARQALALIEDGGFEKPWLLVYDNVEKPGMIEGLIPRRGANVLITTRWPDGGRYMMVANDGSLSKVCLYSASIDGLQFKKAPIAINPFIDGGKEQVLTPHIVSIHGSGNLFSLYFGYGTQNACSKTWVERSVADMRCSNSIHAWNILVQHKTQLR